jgi:hypothetical protein
MEKITNEETNSDSGDQTAQNASADFCLNKYLSGKTKARSGKMKLRMRSGRCGPAGRGGKSRAGETKWAGRRSSEKSNQGTEKSKHEPEASNLTTRPRKNQRERKILRHARAGKARRRGNPAATAEPSRRQPKLTARNQNRVGRNKLKSDTETGKS